jgi:acyl-coenzyme A thioesterase PaaI-like protein
VSDKPQFNADPDPENPGWFHWRISDERRFNAQVMGKMIVRLHGGTILSLIDVGIFGGSRMFGLIEAGTAVTLDLSVQFLGAGKGDVPLDAVSELLKETRRLLFLRGIVEQAGEMVAAFSGTIRKPTVRG